MDYSKIFESTNIYKETYRLIYNHDKKSKDLSIDVSDNMTRAYCSVLRKNKNNYYQEILWF